jgi:hypothetical protein
MVILGNSISGFSGYFAGYFAWLSVGNEKMSFALSLQKQACDERLKGDWRAFRATFEKV